MIAILGPSGFGKTMQCTRLARHHNMEHIDPPPVGALNVLSLMDGMDECGAKGTNVFLFDGEFLLLAHLMAPNAAFRVESLIDSGSSRLPSHLT